jgi:hypothetical protein
LVITKLWLGKNQINTHATIVFSPHFSASTASSNSTISLPVGYILPECPAPFVRDPLAQAGTNNTISAAYCFNGCCIPCPVQEYLYPTGWLANGATATTVIRTVSTGCALFLVISYAILPDKRSHPSLLIFEFFIALFLYSVDVVFALGNPRRIQCSTDIIRSTQDNNTLCAVQGIFHAARYLQGGSYSSMLTLQCFKAVLLFIPLWPWHYGLVL